MLLRRAREFALALEMGARLEDIADTIHTHPTRSEALKEAAANALENLRSGAPHAFASISHESS